MNKIWLPALEIEPKPQSNRESLAEYHCRVQERCQAILAGECRLARCHLPYCRHAAGLYWMARAHSQRDKSPEIKLCRRSQLLKDDAPTKVKMKAAVPRGACEAATNAASINPGLEEVLSVSRRVAPWSSASLSSDDEAF